MRYEELKTGWLSPNGELFECNCWEHDETARKLVGKFRYSEIEKRHADDNLMSRGWVYIGISCFMCHEWRIGWKNFLTEPQKQFLKPYFEESDLPVGGLAPWKWQREGGFYIHGEREDGE